MESSAYEDNRCCHELYKLLETKAGEGLIGGAGFKFDELSLIMLAKTASAKTISLKLAQRDDIASFKLNLAVEIKQANSINLLFIKIYNQSKNKLSPEGFEKYVINALIDFFSLNYQKFN